MLHIFVDADACPVKDEVYRVAARHGLAVTLVSNSPMGIPPHDWLRLGGAIGGRLPAEGDTTILLERADSKAISGDEAAAVALGIEMRRYKFDKYKTSKNDDAKAKPGSKPKAKPGPGKVSLGVADTRAAKHHVAFARS